MKRIGVMILILLNTGILEPSTNHYHRYFWGFYNNLNANYEVARDCYKALLEEKPSSAAYQGYAQHLFDTKNFGTLINLVTSLPKEELEKNLGLQLTFVKALELSGDHTKASEEWIKLSSLYKDNAEIIYYAAAAHGQHQNYQAAFDIIQEYLKNNESRSSNALFYFLQAQLYNALHDHQKALDMLQKCLTINPFFEQGWLLSGLLNELEGHIDSAIYGYRHYLSLTGNNPLVTQQLTQLILKQQNIIKEQEVLLADALKLYQEKKYPQAIAVVDRCLSYNKDHIQARLLKLEILCASNQLETVFELLKTWLNKEPEQEVWFKTLHLIYQAKGIHQEQVIILLSELQKNEQCCPLATLYLADIYLREKNFENAEQMLNKALENTNNENITDRVVYQKACIFFEQRKWDCLAKLLETYKNNNYPPYTNLAAYFYATKGKDIAKASAYLKKTLDQQPSNPHFLETKAVILYKQKEYEEAQKLLITLLEKIPQDFYALKHLAKIRYRQDNINEACSLLKKAAECAYTDFYRKKCLTLMQHWMPHE